MLTKFVLLSALLGSACCADKVFVTNPGSEGTPVVAGKPVDIQWEAVKESSGRQFPDKISIDLMTGPNNAASKAMTIAKGVDPKAGSYKWERVPKDLDPNPTGGGYFLRLGSVPDGFYYGSRFQIKGLTGEPDPEKKPSDDKKQEKEPKTSSASRRHSAGSKPRDPNATEVRAAATTRPPITSGSPKPAAEFLAAALVSALAALVAFALV